MFSIVKKEINWNDTPLSLETGKIARQSDGSVIVTYGQTSILCTVVFEKSKSSEIDFFPLGVHYFEKPYAAGKFPGGFSKREGKPSDREVLVSRLIDRSLRPLFHEDFNNETQVICQVLSYDPNYSPDIPSIIGASAALMISGIPFNGPVASISLGCDKNGNFYHSKQQTDKNTSLHLVVSGTDKGVIMVESEACELEDSKMVDAVLFAHESYQPVIDLIKEFANDAAKPEFPLEVKNQQYLELYEDVKNNCSNDIIAAFAVKEKLKRYAAVKCVLKSFLNTKDAKDHELLKSIFKKVESEILKNMIINDSLRIDGRNLDDIRPIEAEIGLFPNTHGTGLFTRGETQVLSFLTLGSYSDEQITENLEGEDRESFYLHYNFPPYCVGEATKLGPVSRREIGHGKLAFKALNCVIPSKQTFPYTVRLVAEVMESNGSSSMATICASSLALMDGGVPVKTHVAGIAMGLIKAPDGQFKILTDIMGDEDHLGDMDLKVAGTSNGINALQMDIKVENINREIISSAISKARIAINKILEIMNNIIPAPKNNLNSSAPQMKIIKIPEYSIPDLIGPGGKVIREITDKTSSKIDVLDKGEVKIFAQNSEKMAKTLDMIKMAVMGPTEGSVYNGNVVKIIKSGAFIKIADNKEGFLHISEMSDERINEVTDILKEGDNVEVIVIPGGTKGKIRLSMRISAHSDDSVE